MTYKLPEPVQIDKHIPTGIVIRGYTAKHVLDAYTAGVTQTKAKYQSEIDELVCSLSEEENLRHKLCDILTRTVNAVRGEPEPHNLHSWHDLPERVEQLKTYSDELEQTNFVLLDHNKKDQEKQVQQQLDLLSANNDLYQHREILLVHLAEIERLKTENLALTQQNKDLIKTNLITQKEFDELLKDYDALRQDYLQLEFELNVVNSRE